MNRRDFIRTSLATFATAHFFPMTALAKLEAFRSTHLPGSPISEITHPNTQDFTGDDITRPHEALWDKENYIRMKGGMPQATVFADVVVVGGGIAGLTAAYQLRDLNPLLLEMSSKLGGNSQGESYRNSPFSIGAAYITTPEAGSDSEKLLKNLGLLNSAREEKEGLVQLGGVLTPAFWSGASAPGHERHFQAVHQKLLDIGRNRFPDLPYQRDPEGLDRQTVDEWARREFGELHPQIQEFFQLYCWSSFAASTDEVSAYQFLNFLTSDLQGTIALPGGNAAIAQKLHAALPQSRAIVGAMVLDIALNRDGVRICFEDSAGTLRTVQAKSCVYAAPKFTADKIISSLGAAQAQAMDQIEYRAYVVGNIILRKKIAPPCYDLYYLRGTPPPSPSALRPSDRGFTDICFANWSYPAKNSPTVLTAYQALPYQGARQFLFSPSAHEKYLRAFKNNIAQLMPAVGVRDSDVEGIRLTRWGHSLPVASSGLLASGHLTRASAPIQGRIFFANQDNWANPCFETAMQSAFAAAKDVRRSLR